MIQRPSYSSTRWYLWLSFIGAWIVVFAIVGGAIAGKDQVVALGNIALPAMFAIITGNLAVHRGFGSSDFRAQRPLMPSLPPPPYDPRDDPGRPDGGLR